MHTLKMRLLHILFDRYMRWRLAEFVLPQYPVILDYPIKPRPRYGDERPPHPELAAWLAGFDEIHRETLDRLLAFREPLSRIGEQPVPGKPGQPYWGNAYFTGFDAIALYGFLGLLKPARLIEIGSGNSTRFARRAISDLGLRTQITSIDPHPRAEIDDLCERVFRIALEDMDLDLFAELEAGDVLFIDNSHRVFQNSDVTVLFLEILPRLRPGVTVHVHDIFFPGDYPVEWMNRHYSEQYMLAAYILGGGARLQSLLPVVHLGSSGELSHSIETGWTEDVFQRAFALNRRVTGGHIGTSMWLRTVCAPN